MGQTRPIGPVPTFQEFGPDGVAELSALLDEASTTFGDLTTLTGELTTMADALERAAGSVDGAIATVEDSDLVPRLRTMADALGPAGRDLGDLATRLERLIGANDARIADTITSLRRAAIQLEALLEEAEANPSRIIFGEPPPRRTPGDGP